MKTPPGHVETGHKEILQQTRCWLREIVIGLNFCPFAQREFDQQRIHYDISSATHLEAALVSFADALYKLQADDDIETTLVIFPTGFDAFDDFVELIELADQLIDELDFRSVFQIAHFHPDYCFADTEPDDPANFTNRAPFATLHLLRESSLQKAIASHPDTTQIPENNIKLARETGFAKMQALLNHCIQSSCD